MVYGIRVIRKNINKFVYFYGSAMLRGRETIVSVVKLDAEIISPGMRYVNDKICRSRIIGRELDDEMAIDVTENTDGKNNSSRCDPWPCAKLGYLSSIYMFR